MKQAFGIFAALILVPSMQVQAWVGGPWSGNSHQENGDDGVYEAVATTANGVGMYRWAVQNNLDATGIGDFPYPSGQGFTNSNVQFGGLVGAMSPHVWYFRGLVYYGRCFGIVSSTMGIVSVTGNASDTGFDGSGNGVNGVNLAGGLASDFNFATVGSGSTPISNRKTVANSTFQAKISDKKPVKRFKGKGMVSFIGLTDFTLLSIRNPSSVTITGTPAFINSVLVSQTPIAIDASDEFEQQGAKFKFIVFGAQVSTRAAG
jgi:hypothetical protein